jgi:hypothetical protein
MDRAAKKGRRLTRAPHGAHRVIRPLSGSRRFPQNEGCRAQSARFRSGRGWSWRSDVFGRCVLVRDQLAVQSSIPPALPCRARPVRLVVTKTPDQEPVVADEPSIFLDESSASRDRLREQARSFAEQILGVICHATMRTSGWGRPSRSSAASIPSRAPREPSARGCRR